MCAHNHIPVLVETNNNNNSNHDHVLKLPPACHQDGLVGPEALAVHLHRDVGQDVATAQAVQVEQDVARVAGKLYTAISWGGHACVTIWTTMENR